MSLTATESKNATRINWPRSTRAKLLDLLHDKNLKFYRLPVEVIEYLIEFITPQFESRLYHTGPICRPCLTNFKDIYHYTDKYFCRNDERIFYVHNAPCNLRNYRDKYIIIHTGLHIILYNIEHNSYRFMSMSEIVHSVIVTHSQIIIQTGKTMHYCKIYNEMLIIVEEKPLTHGHLITSHSDAVIYVDCKSLLNTVIVNKQIKKYKHEHIGIMRGECSYDSIIFMRYEDHQGQTPYKLNVFTFKLTPISINKFNSNIITVWKPL